MDIFILTLAGTGGLMQPKSGYLSRKQHVPNGSSPILIDQLGIPILFEQFYTYTDILYIKRTSRNKNQLNVDPEGFSQTFN